MPTVYFHGIPGAPAELALLGGAATRAWIAPDRALLPADPAQRYAQLAAIVMDACKGGVCCLVAFSAGVPVALHVAALLPDADLVLHLVSPAAPLETGEYLADMAGGPVFSAARDRPQLFPALVAAQSMFARLFPGVLMRGLFASARGMDRALATDRTFANGIRGVLRHSLTEGRGAYRAEVAAYVEPWADILPTVQHPVTLWQGDTDNWTPPAMAEALATLLPDVRALHILPGMSHYSALQAALAQLTAPS